jgi:alkylresorcinol/alkylpyrone synthase
MPKLVSVGTAVPPHVVTTAEARDFARSFFGENFKDLDRLLALFDHTLIDKRHICQPVEWFASPKSFREKNDAYIEWSLKLGEEAISLALERAGLAVSDVDYLIFVSTTGLATPSMDARIIGHMGMNAHTRRTPIWGLGCAGGVAGVSHAYHHALGHPKSVTVVVALELCSLTFHFGDKSKSNLVATALFADGAAAVVVTGDDVGAVGQTIVDTKSTLWPDSLDVMGWDFESEGMQVVFSRDIPGIVMAKSRDNITTFLHQHGLDLSDVGHLIAHPGGTKVIEAYEQALSLTNGAMTDTRVVLRDYGNMSSASVLFVLDRFLSRPHQDSGKYGLMTALGPGFSSEHVLLGSL